MQQESLNKTFLCFLFGESPWSYKKIDREAVTNSFLDPELEYDTLLEKVHEMERNGQFNVRSLSKSSNEFSGHQMDEKRLKSISESATVDSKYKAALSPQVSEAVQESWLTASPTTHRRFLFVVPEGFENSTHKWLHLEYHVLDLDCKQRGLLGCFARTCKLKTLSVSSKSAVNTTCLTDKIKEILCSSST